MSSISSAVQVRSASDLSEPGFVPSLSARAAPTVSTSCDTIGPKRLSMTTSESSRQLDWVNLSTLWRPDFHANHTAPRLKDETSPSIFGRSSCESSASSDPVGSLLRTFLASDMTALTGCVVISKTGITPSGRSISILRYHRDSVAAFVSSGWPTPTETANHDAPSMRKWPAYALYQDTARRTTPRLWEWMMGLPDEWTACICSETLSRQPSLSSSGEPSCEQS